jgi:hypothetical protein
LLKSNDRAGVFLEEPPTGLFIERKAKVAAAEKPGGANPSARRVKGHKARDGHQNRDRAVRS